MDNKPSNNIKMRRTVVILTLIPLLIGCTNKYQVIGWSLGPPAPTPKTAWATASIGEVVITVGGTCWVDMAQGNPKKIWLSETRLFDTKSMVWKTLPDYPCQAGYAYAVAVGTKVYVIGGRGQTKGNSEVFILDLAKEKPKWYSGPSLPSPRWQHKGGMINGMIYIIGGVEGDLTREDGTKPSFNILTLDTRNPDPGWKHVTNIPSTETQWQAATACDGKLYLFGGLADENFKEKKTLEAGTLRFDGNLFLPLVPQNEVFSFDVVNGIWRNLRSLPTPKSSAACLALDDRYILIAGGVDLAVTASETPDGVPRINWSNQCLLYDTTNDSFISQKPLIKPVCDEGIAYVNGNIFLIGGEGNPWQTRTDFVQIGKFQ